MLRLIRWLILGDAHSHKWVIIQKVNVTEGNKIYSEKRYLQCEICGNIKVHNK